MTHEWHPERPEEADYYQVHYLEHDEQAHVARGWYYRSRLGMEGPFTSRELAEQDVARLMNSDVWELEEDQAETEK